MKKETIEFLDKCALMAYPLSYQEWKEWHLSDENVERNSESFDDYRNLIAHSAYEMAEAMVMQRAETIANLQKLINEPNEEIKLKITHE